jgi:hypothetical protein
VTRALREGGVLDVLDVRLGQPRHVQDRPSVLGVHRGQPDWLG